MKRIFTSLFLCTWLLTACNQESSIGSLMAIKETNMTLKEEIPQDFIPKIYHVVSVGDSLTQGVGDSTNRGGYLPYLEEHLEEQKGIKDAVIQNYGVKGNRTSQILHRIQTTEIRGALKKADIVMITTGGNDVMKVVRENFLELELDDFDHELNLYQENLNSILESIREENKEALICLIGLYNPFYSYFTDIKELNTVMDNWNEVSQIVLANYENTIFVDIAEDFKDSEENLLFTDYFHPNDRGYELIAERAFSVLQEEAFDNKYFALKRENDKHEE